VSARSRNPHANSGAALDGREREQAAYGLGSGTVSAAAVVYVKHLDRMRSFYQHCFALEAVYTSEAYCVLESGSWRLALVVIPDETADRIELTVPPRRREEVPVKLAFEVASFEDLRTTAPSLGGQVDPSTAEWDFRGQRRCDGVDPEGNIIQLLEPPTDAGQT
jgi:predicted enzyme related to lactoylglutathione lyase